MCATMSESGDSYSTIDSVAQMVENYVHQHKAEEKMDVLDFLNTKMSNLKLDDDDSEASEPETVNYEDAPKLKPLPLYNYQKELSAAICSDKRPNCLVTCETNSGKTLVAVNAIRKWSSENPKSGGKFAFLTHKVSLCEQQFSLICKYISSEAVAICHGEITNKRNVFLNSRFAGMESLEKSIFVFTAQTFLNLLERKKFSLKNFTLIVFDECHHCDSKHPYNEVMLNYLMLKLKVNLRPPELPQILGLTASPTIFEKTINDEDDAKEMLKALMFNMDTAQLSFVEEEMDDLKQKCSPPEECIEFIEPDQSNKFSAAIKKLMVVQLKFIQQAYEKLAPRISRETNSLFQLDLDWPEPLDEQKFETWARDLGKKDSKVPEFQVCLVFSAKLLVELCLILRLVPTIHYDILLEKIDNFYETQFNSGSDDAVHESLKSFYDAFKHIYVAHKGALEATAKENADHKMMNRLKEIILREVKESPIAGSSEVKNRGIVFIQTKAEAQILNVWANGDEDLKDLKSQFITADVANQTDLLNSFRNGECRLLFATSVIEEGIDIPDCKLVINYNNRINHIQQLQQKGRARMNRAQYYVISCNEHFHALAQGNQDRQALTEEAVRNLSGDLRNDNLRLKVMSQMRVSQENAVEGFLARKSEKKAPKSNDHVFVFTCKECTNEVFRSDQVFIFKESLRVVFIQNYESKFRSKPQMKDQKTTKTKKFFDMIGIEANLGLFCFKCKNKLGQLIRFGFFGLINPMLESYLVSHSDEDCKAEECKVAANGVMKESKVFKQWKKVPFAQRQIGVDEVKENFLAMRSLSKEVGVFQQLTDAEPIVL